MKMGDVWWEKNRMLHSHGVVVTHQSQRAQRDLWKFLIIQVLKLLWNAVGGFFSSLQMGTPVPPPACFSKCKSLREQTTATKSRVQWELCYLILIYDQPHRWKVIMHFCLFIFLCVCVCVLWIRCQECRAVESHSLDLRAGCLLPKASEGLLQAEVILKSG